MFDYAAAHALSVGLAEVLDEEDSTVGLGVVAMLLLIGRCLSESELAPEEEVEFIQAGVDFVGAYFAGESN